MSQSTVDRFVFVNVALLTVCLLFPARGFSSSNDGYRLCRVANPGCTAGGTIVAINSGTEVNEWCTCKILNNASGSDVFVPTKTEAEYRAFLNNLPASVTVGACVTNSGNGTYQVTAATASLSVRGCDRLNGTLNGGGGGGGIRSSATASAGVGGIGGRITLTASTLTTTTTSTVTITLGNGGEGGACRSGALGGTGGYAGGRGSIRTATAGAANWGLVGAGTSANGGNQGSDVGSDHGAGDGEYGGGGGGGDRNAGNRNGGGGGAATVLSLDATEILIAGGGGGGGGTRGNTAPQIGGAAGNACNGSVNGQAGTNDNSSVAAGPGGGGGACLSSLGGAAYSAAGGAAGAANAACGAGTGTNGSVNLVFSRSTALP